MRREVSTGTPQLAIGLFVMAIGVLLTLDRLNVIDAGRIVRYWPTALIALGVAIWMRGRDAQGRFWGSVWIFVGTWLLLNTLGIVRIGFWELFWPLVLVLVGLKLVLHTVRQGQRKGDATVPGGTSLFAMLGESKRSSDDKAFRGGQMTAIMGGCHLDLRGATIPAGEEAVVDVFALMGGLEIWVPSGWTVIPDVVPILGGVEDKRLLRVGSAPGEGDAQAPARLLLRGQVVMGGLTIKN
jgi:predicted membrane protein